MSLQSHRELLTEVFEEFLAQLLGVDSEVALCDQGADPDDADRVENEFRGRTWHNLIYYHFRWDGAMLLRWSLTDDAYVNVLPSYLCASLLWPEVEPVKIAADLLVPIDLEFKSDSRTLRFQFLRRKLTKRQRDLVRRYLIYVLGENQQAFEWYFSTSKDKIHGAIEDFWEAV